VRNDNAAVMEQHARFLQRVIDSGEVWALRADEGWCVAPSNQDEEVAVMPFWSDAAYARRCAVDEWEPFEATPVPLELFLEQWLPGLHGEGDLVGTDWDANLIGLEIEPLELKRQLEEKLDQGRTGT